MNRRLTAALTVLSICLVPAILIGSLHYFNLDPEHLTWCREIEFRNDGCIFYHWPGRFQLLGISIAIPAFFGLFTLWAREDVAHRFERIERRVAEKHRKP